MSWNSNTPMASWPRRWLSSPDSLSSFTTTAVEDSAIKLAMVKLFSKL